MRLPLRQLFALVALTQTVVESSPIARRDEVTLTTTADLQTITPAVVLDSAQLPVVPGEEAKATPTPEPTPSPIPAPILELRNPDPTLVPRKKITPTATDRALTIVTTGPFVAIDVGSTEAGGGNGDCTPTTIDGPIQTLQVFLGESNIRALTITNTGQNTTHIPEKLEDGMVDAGVFEFADDERITDLWVFASTPKKYSLFAGFNFTTSKGNNYVAKAQVLSTQHDHGEPWAVKVDTASGILGRLRPNVCKSGIIASIGFDFVDDIDTIAISHISYDGLPEGGILPAGKGQTIGQASQIIDNRNSSIDQWIILTTSDAVTKSHSISTQTHWIAGAHYRVEQDVGVPGLASTKVANEFRWEVGQMYDTTDLQSETITHGSQVNLKCPAKKYCVGSSFYTTFRIDLKIDCTMTATTKSGKRYSWKQSGEYKGVDSQAQQLKVDETDDLPVGVASTVQSPPGLASAVSSNTNATSQIR